MPPKKTKAKKEITQKQSQKQNINIRIGDLSTKKPRKKRAPRAPRPAVLQSMVNLPPVVYQIPSMLTSYGIPPEPARRTIADPIPVRSMITDPIPAPRSIVDPIPARRSIVDPIPARRSIVDPIPFVDLVPEADPRSATIDPVELVPYKDTAPKKQLRGFQFPSPFDNVPEAQAFAFTDLNSPTGGDRLDPEDYLTEADAVPIVKRKGGRPKGRPNRTQEEIRQMQMDELERKRLRDEARSIKNAGKEARLKKKTVIVDSGAEDVKVIRQKLSKKLQDIEDQRQALAEGTLRASEL